MAVDTALTEKFAELFAGRRDAYGTDRGGCVRLYGVNGDATLRLVDFEVVLREHLDGKPIGIYPMKPFGDGWIVKWGAVDLDIKVDGKPSYDYQTEAEAHVASINLFRTLQAFGLNGWVERTRSRGRHVWVFANQWVPASTMRRALLVACQIACVSTREINPKQETLGDGQLGNYVRAPYPGGHKAVGQQMVVATEYHTTIPYGEFVQYAHATRTTVDKLQKVAALWTPPAPSIAWGPRSYPSSFVKDDGYPPVVRAVIANGPRGDRSSALMYLAAKCAQAQLAPADALLAVDDAAARWGKFDGRKDRMKQLQRIVERAYA